MGHLVFLYLKMKDPHDEADDDGENLEAGIEGDPPAVRAIRKAARRRLLPLEDADDYRVLVVLVTCSAA